MGGVRKEGCKIEEWEGREGRIDQVCKKKFSCYQIIKF
jgi:hypothetical protein